MDSLEFIDGSIGIISSDSWDSSAADTADGLDIDGNASSRVDALRIGERILELDEMLEQAWMEAQTYSASPDPKSRNPAESAGMEESQWDALSESKQRFYIRDWRTRWKLDRAYHIAKLERERAVAKTELANLSDRKSLAALLSEESEFWEGVEAKWKNRADDYVDTVKAMDSQNCWPN